MEAEVGALVSRNFCQWCGAMKPANPGKPHKHHGWCDRPEKLHGQHIHGIADAVERGMEEALTMSGIAWNRADASETHLDFYLPDLDLHIEVKSWACERMFSQLRKSGVEERGIIVVIGLEGVRKFARMLRPSPNPVANEQIAKLGENLGEAEKVKNVPNA